MAEQKIKGAANAVGYWGRDAATHIAALQTSERVLALNRDKVFAMGLPFRLWNRLVTPTQPHEVQCSCWKDTTQQSDAPCLSCYGLRYQPGYYRFGYHTIFSSSIHNDLVLTNVELNKTITPFRLQLATGQISGTILTPSYTITDTNLGAWEVHLDAFPRAAGNTVVGEFTIDNGGTWNPLVNLGTANLNPTSGGTIQFRVMMTRSSISSVSPLFEIIRARFPVVPSPRTRNPDPAAPGDILVLKTWDQERFRREMAGVQTEVEGDRFWTLPLTFFDSRINRETFAAILGPDHFLEEAKGPETGVRYVSTKHSYSRQFKMFTRQEFNLRRVIGQAGQKTLGETIMRVW
jgi:hypothetical protein